MTRTVAALAAALLATSCGAPLMKLPSGPAGPASDGTDVVTQATRACRTVSTIKAEVAIRGSVAGRRLRARLLAGLSTPESARLEAPAPFGQPVFIFVARAGDATLLLPRDGRVLEHGRPEAILEALTGMSLTPSDLRTMLTGCAETSAGSAARRFGDEWRVIPGATDVYLRRERLGEPWRIVAVVHHGPARAEWRAEFRDFQNDLPRTIRIRSTDRRFDLTLGLSQVDINAPLEPDVFRVSLPGGVKPITIEELRRSGPLADTGAGPASRDSVDVGVRATPDASIGNTP